MTDKLIPYEGQELKEGDKILLEAEYVGRSEDHTRFHNVRVCDGKNLTSFEEIAYIIQKPNTSFETMEPGYHYLLNSRDNKQYIVFKLDEMDDVLMTGCDLNVSINRLPSMGYTYLGPVEEFKK